MKRRDLLAATTATLSTLGLAGCVSTLGTGGPAGQPTDPTETETTRTDPRAAPELSMAIETVEETWRKVVHMDGDEVTSGATASVEVRVDGERVPVVPDATSTSSFAGTATLDERETFAYWVADEDQVGEGQAAAVDYPISVGNKVFFEAEAGQTVTVVWNGEFVEPEVLLETTIDE
ncbi:hypothetical protein [Haloarchaeobius baliensis]|uniref:hypothetical protein n=1 Tax=Haloarchaeobius baliensis TaxID=1670458 RepID=UPI003F881262